jgi:hypothetical protein
MRQYTTKFRCVVFASLSHVFFVLVCMHCARSKFTPEEEAAIVAENSQYAQTNECTVDPIAVYSGLMMMCLFVIF